MIGSNFGVTSRFNSCAILIKAPLTEFGSVKLTKSFLLFNKCIKSSAVRDSWVSILAFGIRMQLGINLTVSVIRSLFVFGI
mgnify:CR=1 FL=1